MSKNVHVIDGMLVHSIDITDKVWTTVDLVSQFCRQYKLPYGKGLNIRYLHVTETHIQASVEIIDWQLSHDFVVHLVLEERGWSIKSNSYIKIHFPLNFDASSFNPIFQSHRNIHILTVKCDETGNYEFTAVK